MTNRVDHILITGGVVFAGLVALLAGYVGDSFVCTGLVWLFALIAGLVAVGVRVLIVRPGLDHNLAKC